MNQNPYTSPQASDGESSDGTRFSSEALSSDSPRRPFGISFVAGMMAFSAVGAIADGGSVLRSSFAGFADVKDPDQWSRLSFVAAWMVGLAAFRLLAAFGMAAGRRWSWYAACFSLAVLSLHYVAGAWGGGDNSVARQSFEAWQAEELRGQMIVRAVMAIAGFVYIQRSGVLRYFRVSQYHLPWVLVCILSAAATSLLALRNAP